MNCVVVMVSLQITVMHVHMLPGLFLTTLLH